MQDIPEQMADISPTALEAQEEAHPTRALPREQLLRSRAARPGPRKAAVAPPRRSARAEPAACPSLGTLQAYFHLKAGT